MKHALYSVTKNIPIPNAVPKSHVRGPTALLSTMKKGDSVMIPTKQVQSFKQAASRLRMGLVSARVGKGANSRLWFVSVVPEKAKAPAKVE